METKAESIGLVGFWDKDKLGAVLVRQNGGVRAFYKCELMDESEIFALFGENLSAINIKK